MWSTLQFSRDLQFSIQLKYLKYSAVLLGFIILGTVKIGKVDCSFAGIYNSWYSWNMRSTLQVCRDLMFLRKLKSVKYTSVLLGFTILGTVEICEVHCSFLGIDNCWYSWNMWSTLQFCTDLQFLVRLKYMKYTAAL